MLSRVIIFSLILAAASAVFADDAIVESRFYETGVKPLLIERCGSCHNSDDPDGALDLTSATGLVAGGESGPVFKAGYPRDSLIMARIRNGEMPPDGETPLTPAEIETLHQWIVTGARFKKPPASSRKVTQHDVIPILLLRCTTCHGTRRKEGGLDLRTRESILKGGKSGPVVVSGHPEKSRLIQRIANEEMPPRRELVSVSVKTMPESERKTVEQWIRNGLPEAEPDTANHEPIVSDEDRNFWSFIPPRQVSVPMTDRKFNNPIDSFIEHRLNEDGLSMAPSPDRATLLRRVYFDLIGLPPTLEQFDRFITDDSPEAWENLVDDLLDSPRHGERWARHWLDAAGYADSEGAQNEDRVRPHFWRYRDYVIRSLNADKPYDQFLTEQIAGDELADVESAPQVTQKLYDNLVATGFLRTAPDRTFANITNFVPDRLEVIADEMQIFGTAVLGLTLQCARCHDHKFDPISQRDYYSLTAIFKDALDEHDWLKSQGPRTLPLVTTEERTEWQQHEQAINKKIAPLRKQLEAESDSEKKKAIEAEIKKIESDRLPEPRIRALWSRGEPSPTYLLLRGNYETPGRLLQPAVPAVLTSKSAPFAPQPLWEKAGKTGRRLALARWLTHEDHPLTARVIVNRIWKHHFGRGIVETLDNFGLAGSPPTHPELLDWLAVEFVKQGWSMKWLHRLVVTSEAWQQRSTLKLDEGSQLTEEKRAGLFYGMPLRRMDAEVARDTMLSIAGQLDLTPFGKPDPVDERPDGLITSRKSEKGWRRSIFVQQRRTKIPTLLDNFDFPQMGPNCVVRDESIVVTQALHLLHNGMVHELAANFTDRVRDLADSDRTSQIRAAWKLAINRPPTPEEEGIAVDSIDSLTQRWMADGVDEAAAQRKALGSFCHGLINSAAFIYID